MTHNLLYKLLSKRTWSKIPKPCYRSCVQNEYGWFRSSLSGILYGSIEAVTYQALTPQDFSNARRFPERRGPRKLFSSGKFEGDIELGGQSLDYYTTTFPLGDAGERMSNAIRDTAYRWEGGKVPYLVARGFTDYERSRIAKAIEAFDAKTCIKFVPRTRESDYVLFVKEDGCWSYVGRRGGKQKISIGDGCAYTGVVQHEMMHAVGFFHEQSRNDRDKCITINWNNIKQGRESNFQKYNLDRITHLGAKYDYGSIMHYGAKAFSKNGKPTISAPKPIGQSDGFSSIDVQKLNKMYECSGGGGGGTGETCVDRFQQCRRFRQRCQFLKPMCCKTCQSSSNSGNDGNNLEGNVGLGGNGFHGSPDTSSTWESRWSTPWQR